MGKSRNNLLGVGGQRTRIPRSGQAGPDGAADRTEAADRRQELLRKMRARNTGTQDAQDTQDTQDAQAD